MLDLIRRLIICHQIIIFVIPGQRPGADHIPCSALLNLQFLIQSDDPILERNLFILMHRLVDAVHVIKNALIDGLYPVADKHFPLQSPCLLPRRTLRQFADQLFRLAHRNELGRLDRIDQKLKLRKFKIPCSHEVPARAPFLLDDVQTELPQHLHIGIGRPAVRRQVVLPEIRSDLRRVDSMLLIRLFHQVFHCIEQRQLSPI